MYAEQPKGGSSSSWKRRQLKLANVAAGFASAVQPIFAQTIITDSEGLEAGPVTIPTPDGEIPGYRAKPTGSGPFPLVLVVQEIFGVHEHIQDICRRLGKLGYVAVAPELFFRQGDVSQLQSLEEIRAIVSQVPDAQVMS
ncbi:dienelactone hydrolase family protein, partial [Synechococcus sp. R55.2]